MIVAKLLAALLLIVTGRAMQDMQRVVWGNPPKPRHPNPDASQNGEEG